MAYWCIVEARPPPVCQDELHASKQNIDLEAFERKFQVYRVLHCPTTVLPYSMVVVASNTEPVRAPGPQRSCFEVIPCIFHSLGCIVSNEPDTLQTFAVVEYETIVGWKIQRCEGVTTNKSK